MIPLSLSRLKQCVLARAHARIHTHLPFYPMLRKLPPILGPLTLQFPLQYLTGYPSDLYHFLREAYLDFLN